MRRVPVEPGVPAESSRYEDLLVNAPIGVYRADPKGNLLDGNPALARMLGRSSLEDLFSENGSGPFSTRERARFWLRLEKEGEINGYESEWTRSDGGRVYLREHARAVRGPNRETLCYEGTLEDISDRRAAEKQIQKERDFSSAVIDTAGSLVLILDREGRIIRFNRACEALSGFNFHDVAEKPVWEVLTAPVEVDETRDYFQKLLDGQYPATHESSWMSTTGELRQIAWSDSALLDENGAIRNVIAMGIDITGRKAAEDALRQSESRYRELFESASDIVFRMSLDGKILSINGAAARLTGYSKDTISDIGEVLDADQFDLTRKRLSEKLDGVADTQYELKIRAADGSYVYVELKTTLSYENGEPIEILGIGRDITWRKRVEETERGRRAILEMTARHEPLPEVMLKLAHIIEGQFPHSVCSIDVAASLPGGVQTPSAGEAPSQPRNREESADGEGRSAIVRQPEGDCQLPAYQVLQTGTPEFGLGFRMKWQLPVPSREHGQLAVITILLPRTGVPTPHESDILTSKVKLATLTIENHLMTDGLRWNAHHDKLTGLANRELFEEKLRAAMAASNNGEKPGDERPLAILFFDLDRFRLVNDTLGHEVGDMLIKAVAQRLSDKIGHRGFVARMGADEFMVMINPVWSREEADSLARELLTCFETPFEAGSQELFDSASMGCSMYPWDGEDVQTLQRNADTAMHRAKASGRNRFLQFAPVMTAGLGRRLKIQNQLHRAQDRGELQLYYQPQHDLKDDRMIGVEALLRWNSPDLGSVSPAEFIPVAEESGLIVGIGTWVLREACRQCREWCDAGHPLKVAVNVSALQFARPDFIETVQSALRRSGIPPELLELELTETVLMQEPTEASTELDRLREIGVLVSIDDFGTGYSSLAYLQRLPIQSVKIDLSFVRSISENEEVPPLIRAITALARGLNIDVLAEGVEQPYQARVLRRAGCNRVQGYLYGRPAPSVELTRLLATDCRPSQLAHA
jgi:diguanylate cyclase (GGDEF)-like protein/PAS domain S-box-containing protein